MKTTEYTHSWRARFERALETSLFLVTTVVVAGEVVAVFVR